jgi:hypothetical protein
MQVTVQLHYFIRKGVGVAEQVAAGCLQVPRASVRVTVQGSAKCSGGGLAVLRRKRPDDTPSDAITDSILHLSTRRQLSGAAVCTPGRRLSEAAVEHHACRPAAGRAGACFLLP